MGALLAAGYAAGVLLVDPFDGSGGLACPLHAATGLHCPGCGSTRAAWLLLHGDVGGAVRHNALVVPVLLALVARWLVLAAPARTASFPLALRAPSTIPRRAVLALAAGLVAFGVARNLPGLDLLAPPV